MYQRTCSTRYPGLLNRSIPKRLPLDSLIHNGPQREYRTFHTARLPEALTHQVVAGRAAMDTAQTAMRPPIRLLRQSMRGLTRSHWVRAGQEPLHSTIGQDWSEQ